MDNKTLNYIMQHNPSTISAKLHSISHEIEESLSQHIPVKTIWKAVCEVHEIDCSYEWFARFVRQQIKGENSNKKSNEKPTSSTTKAKSDEVETPTQSSQNEADQTIEKKPAPIKVNSEKGAQSATERLKALSKAPPKGRSKDHSERLI